MLDTRGWARFVSGLPGYDYWHVRQALTDSHLSYILVGLDELKASSPRAATLRALLAYVGTPLEEFPASPERPDPGRADLPLPTPGLMGRNRPVNYGSLWQRWTRGVRWTWVNDRYRDALPADFDAGLMALDTPRPAARQAGPIDRPGRLPRGSAHERIVASALSVYLKRQYRLPWRHGWRRRSIPRGGTRPRPPRVDPPGTGPGTGDRGSRGRRRRRADRPPCAD